MDIWLATEIDNAKQSILETYELMETYSAHIPNDKSELRNHKTYLQFMERLCEIMHESTVEEQALRVAGEKRTVDDFITAYEKERANERRKFNVKLTVEYKNFEKRLQEVTDKCAAGATVNSSRVECDEFVMEGVINVYDPMTKLRMQNPVRNKLCGHHYDKATILEAISANKLRCPVAGCGNKKRVNAAHLIEDSEMKKRIMQMKQTESQDPLD